MKNVYYESTPPQIFVISKLLNYFWYIYYELTKTVIRQGISSIKYASNSI